MLWYVPVAVRMVTGYLAGPILLKPLVDRYAQAPLLLLQFTGCFGLAFALAAALGQVHLDWMIVAVGGVNGLAAYCYRRAIDRLWLDGDARTAQPRAAFSRPFGAAGVETDAALFDPAPAHLGLRFDGRHLPFARRIHSTVLLDSGGRGGQVAFWAWLRRTDWRRVLQILSVLFRCAVGFCVPAFRRMRGARIGIEIETGAR